MIGLVLIYFVGKAFYDLAVLHDKNKWGFAILGVISYYAGLFLGGVIMGIIVELFLSPGFVDDSSNEIILGLSALPLGVLSCWGTYQLLKKSWSKPKQTDNSTLDGGLISNEPINRYNQGER